jgi:hypothetical protein
MAIRDALGLARRAGGIAQHRCVTLVQLRPLQDRAGGRQQQVEVVDQARRCPAERDRGGSYHDDVPHAGAPGQDAGELRDEVAVDDHHPVARVVDDVGQLVVRQAQVEGVQHRTHRRHREVRRQVRRRVPAQRRHHIIAADAQCLQRPRQAAGSRGKIGEGCAARRCAVELSDGCVGMHSLAVDEHVGDQHIGILHGAVHGCPPSW